MKLCIIVVTAGHKAREFLLGFADAQEKHDWIVEIERSIEALESHALPTTHFTAPSTDVLCSLAQICVDQSIVAGEDASDDMTTGQRPKSRRQSKVWDTESQHLHGSSEDDSAEDDGLVLHSPSKSPGDDARTRLKGGMIATRMVVSKCLEASRQAKIDSAHTLILSSCSLSGDSSNESVSHSCQVTRKKPKRTGASLKMWTGTFNMNELPMDPENIRDWIQPDNSIFDLYAIGLQVSQAREKRQSRLTSLLHRTPPLFCIGMYGH
jgi:hypothetical protein